MKADSCLDKIVEVVRNVTSYGKEVNRDTDFVEDIGVDSLEQVKIIIAIEEAFDLDINDEVAVLWEKVSDVESYILSLSNENNTVH